jgi:hypothetical protein
MEIEIKNAFPQSFQTQTESAKAVEEIRASMIIAKKFPRNELDAMASIEASCKRLSLAKTAMYSYPRGGQQVTGPSINLAKTIARCYGNIHFGIKELETRGDETLVEVFAHDLETNYRPNRIFTVKHERSTKKGTTKLTDQRDVYELIANLGARRLRACLLDIIPPDVTEEAIRICESTLEKGDTAPMAERISKMITAFGEIGITKEMIEARLMHKIDVVNQQELVQLQKIFVSIRDGYSKREDYFDLSVSKAKEDIDRIIKGE